MKPIIPSLREKNRYLVYKVRSNEKVSFNGAKSSLENACLKFMGGLGMARAGVMIMNEFKNNKGIVKVNNKYLNELHASLLLIEQIEGKKIFWNGDDINGGEGYASYATSNDGV